jgi:hypothetical protein
VTGADCGEVRAKSFCRDCSHVGRAVSKELSSNPFHYCGQSGWIRLEIVLLCKRLPGSNPRPIRFPRSWLESRIQEVSDRFGSIRRAYEVGRGTGKRYELPSCAGISFVVSICGHKSEMVFESKRDRASAREFFFEGNHVEDSRMSFRAAVMST